MGQSISVRKHPACGPAPTLRARIEEVPSTRDPRTHVAWAMLAGVINEPEHGQGGWWHAQFCLYSFRGHDDKFTTKDMSDAPGRDSSSKKAKKVGGDGSQEYAPSQSRVSLNHCGVRSEPYPVRVPPSQALLVSKEETLDVQKTSEGALKFRK
jgi:hypothetical protein